MSGQRWMMALTVGAVWASAAALAAGRPAKTPALGYVTYQGEVRLDRQAVPAGTVVFAGDAISTGNGALASVKLLSGAQATLGENGELIVAAGDSVAPIRLVRGTLALRQAGESSAHIRVGDGTVVLKGEKGFPAVCRVAFVGGRASVFADRGQVEVHRRGFSRLLRPGKSYRVEAGRPQAAGEHAGKVTNAIPQGTVQHPNQTHQLNLSVNDGVVWHDTVRTLGTGRVRIGLEDGSVLNIGVRSMMRIVRHDAQSQQTEIEMQLGKLRGQVVKLSKPGASFQIKTQTAVIGVVGTLLTITASAKNTQVVCIEGKVNVKNIDPKVQGEKTLGPGEQTNVPVGQPPSPPVPATASQVAQELNLTNAGEVPTPDLAKFGEVKFAGVTAPAPPPGAPPSVPPAAPGLQIASGVATGTSAVLGGAALTKASDATDLAADATNAADEATAAAAAAADAAADAATVANSFSNGLQDYIDTLSPPGGCACLP